MRTTKILVVQEYEQDMVDYETEVALDECGCSTTRYDKRWSVQEHVAGAAGCPLSS